MFSRSWSRLHPDLVETIANCLTEYIDYVRFRAVCVSWRSSTPKFPIHLPPQLPWLMIPSIEDKTENHHLRYFFSLSENKYHVLELPECSGKRFSGSSHGWLLTLENSPMVSIFNPITKTEIQLPPLTTFPNVEFDPSFVDEEFTVIDSPGDPYTYSFKEMHDYFIRKMVLSSSPSSSSSSSTSTSRKKKRKKNSMMTMEDKDDDFMVVAILCFREIAFMKKGVKLWTLLNDPEFEFEDVIFHKGQFYAVDVIRRVAVCNFDDLSSPKVTVILQGPKGEIGTNQYLVDSFGELLLISRIIEHKENGDYITRKFRVFKLNQIGQKWHWHRVRDLGDRVLFLGPNSSVSLLASDFSGCKRNCIYFADSYYVWHDCNESGGHDFGVFHLSDGSIEALPCHQGDTRLVWPPPTWVIPNPG